MVLFPLGNLICCCVLKDVGYAVVSLRIFAILLFPLGYLLCCCILGDLGYAAVFLVSLPRTVFLEDIGYAAVTSLAMLPFPRGCRPCCCFLEDVCCDVVSSGIVALLLFPRA